MYSTTPPRKSCCAAATVTCGATPTTRFFRLRDWSSADQAKLRRNVGIGGVTFRPTQKISLTAEAEVASSGGAYFRTSLYDYQKVRAQARYQA